MIDFINNNPELAGNTAIILTADHGGSGTGNGDVSNPEIYTIPFYAWLAGQQIGEEIYDLNLFTRTDPEGGRPGYDEQLQPIRNGDAANLALDLLGLGPLTGSSINVLQDLSIVEFILGDLNDDGFLDTVDWLQFLTGHGGDYDGMTFEQTYALGDLDGDLDNDLDDFVLFHSAYDRFNGEGAFAALAVPEPSTFVLTFCCCVVFVAYQLRSKHRIARYAL